MKSVKRLSSIFAVTVMAGLFLIHESKAQGKKQTPFPHNPNGADIAFTVFNIDSRKNTNLPIDVDNLGPEGELTAEFLGQFDIDFYKFVNIEVDSNTPEHFPTYRLIRNMFADQEAKNIARTIQHLINQKKLDEQSFVKILEQDITDGAEGVNILNYIINAKLHRTSNPKTAQKNVQKIWNHLAIHMTKEQHDRLKARIERLIKEASPALQNYRAKQSPSPKNMSYNGHAIPNYRSPR